MLDLAPILDVLPDPQKNLWASLGEVPDFFTLYGGTAIALQLGHRISIDFDFFCFHDFDPEKLLRKIPFLDGADVLQMDENTLTCSVDFGGLVQVSFFGLPKLMRLLPPHQLKEPKIQIANLIDLAGMKAMVVQKRAQLKDYLDILALLNTGISLEIALSAASRIYDTAFNPQITLKALSYFEDGDVNQLEIKARETILEAVKRVNLDCLPKIGEEL